MTRDAASFDKLYRDMADPWDYETSPYEAEKYHRCLALLPRRSFGRGLELGCSIGVMSREIAARCDSLLALDFAPAPGGSCLVAGYLGPTQTTLTAREVEARLLGRLAAARPRHRIRRDADTLWTAAVFDCAADQDAGR